MCCFSRPVKHVSATHIFARLLPPPTENRQVLVYSMNVEIGDELAMVLPIPIAQKAAEDSVRFVDLSAYPKFFRDFADAFPPMLSYPKRGGLRFLPQSRPRTTLEVHDVGDFVASFVPSPRDFDRLDTRFRLAPSVFEKREEYTDYGFAVFQLKPRKGWFGKIKRQTVHPMAFTFPTRRPNALFFPTLHVHDGHDVPPRASFDHSLYCQSPVDELPGFEKSAQPLDRHVDVARAKGLIAPNAYAYRRAIHSEAQNEDLWFEPVTTR